MTKRRSEHPKLPDIVERLRSSLKYALDNIEGIINETDIPSTAILGNGRALLKEIERSPAPAETDAPGDDGRRLGHSRLVYNKVTRTIDTVVTPRSPAPAEDGEKLWVWRDGKDRFLAFRSLFPLMPDCDDPATIGQPSGYAFYHPMTLAEAQKVSREADRTALAEDGEAMENLKQDIARYITIPSDLATENEGLREALEYFGRLRGYATEKDKHHYDVIRATLSNLSDTQEAMAEIQAIGDGLREAAWGLVRAVVKHGHTLNGDAFVDVIGANNKLGAALSSGRNRRKP